MTYEQMSRAIIWRLSTGQILIVLYLCFASFVVSISPCDSSFVFNFMCFSLLIVCVLVFSCFFLLPTIMMFKKTLREG